MDRPRLDDSNVNLLLLLSGGCLLSAQVGLPALSQLLYFTAGWTVVVLFYRAAIASRRQAAAAVSLTYCASAVSWSLVSLAFEAWPGNAFDFEFGARPLGLHLDMRAFLLFSVSYFASDLYFDWDPRFVVHHVLSLAAMGTTWLVPGLQGSFTMTVLIAEVGGVAFHVSKLVRRDWMTWTYLYTYAATRLLAFPALLLWLSASLDRRSPLFYAHLWATSGTAVLVAINVKWCARSWRRHVRDVAARRKAAAAAKAKAEEDAPAAAPPASTGGGAPSPGNVPQMRPVLAKATPPPTPDRTDAVPAVRGGKRNRRQLSFGMSRRTAGSTTQRLRMSEMLVVVSDLLT